MKITLCSIALLLAAPAALAGTPDAPEIADPAGDCEFAPANHYADIIAAWISDETAMDFLVHLRLAEWLQDAAGAYAGYTVQFSHQGVQWGIAAFYDPQAGWEFSTATIDTTTGERGNFTDTSGTWDASTATMSVVFPKSIFPHDGNDNKLSGFVAGSADFKKDIPFFIAAGVTGMPPPLPLTFCDRAESTATYTFQVGQHTMRESATMDATAQNDSATDAPEDVDRAAAPEARDAPAKETPSPSAALVLLVAACLVALRRGK